MCAFHHLLYMRQTFNPLFKEFRLLISIEYFQGTNKLFGKLNTSDKYQLLELILKLKDAKMLNIY